MRPSYSELNKKLSKATELLKEGKIQFCEDSGELSHKVDDELLWLSEHGYDDESKWCELIIKCINEIQATGKILDCYKNANGKSPPVVSFEPEACGEPFWPFVWESKTFNLKMYLKFVVLKNSYLYLSLHESRY